MKKLISLILLLSFTIKAQDVTIGAQVWATKNLDVETYRNGDTILQVEDQEEWATIPYGAFCYIKIKGEKVTTYGKLYNWYAVNDPRGLAPKGYHIPTDAEWTTLTDNLGGLSLAGTKMKNTSGWEAHNSMGDDRTIDGNGTNSSGFSGLPGGYGNNNGKSNSKGKKGIWWSSSECGSIRDEREALADGASSARSKSWCRMMSNEGGKVHRHESNWQEGLSVRCLRD
jgi:uncharacterized protein (TIGR02145 family)